MVQGRYINLRINADNLFQQAKSFLKEGNWDEAVKLYILSIKESVGMPEHHHNKDDHYLLANCYRDLAWLYRQRDLSSSLTDYRTSMTHLANAIKYETGEQPDDPRYLEAVSACQTILTDIVMSLLGKSLTSHEQAQLELTLACVRYYFDFINNKFLQAHLSKDWVDQLEKSKAEPDLALLVNGQRRDSVVKELDHIVSEEEQGHHRTGRLARTR
jgi:hypothetical protein